MAAEYHVRIKKDFAVGVIEELEKQGAIELLGPASEVNEEVPGWQQEEVRRRIAARKADPSLLLSKEEAEAAIYAMTKR